MGKKVVLTGATGLIGKEAIEPLKQTGFEVICLHSNNCNLFDMRAVSNLFEKHKPEYLLHFAWCTGGDYLSNPVNEKFCDSSMDMLHVFRDNGGKRAVFAGTCFEYELKSEERLAESSVIAPKTLYAQKKAELNQKSKEFCKKNGLSFAWGRIFYVFGHNEKEGRLTSSIISSLRNDQKVVIKYGQLVRDYMYSNDVANAFVSLLDTSVDGDVNICTGKGISLADYAKTIAKRLHKENLVDIHTEQTAQPLKIIGDNNRLKNDVGYHPKYDFNSAIEKILTIA